MSDDTRDTLALLLLAVIVLASFVVAASLLGLPLHRVAY